MNATSSPETARVLVVDDEVALAGVVAAYLSRAGYDTRMAHTGPDAVQAVRDHHPDVVILDLGLPGLDGIEVCRQIRTFSDCYVIILTARADEIDTLIGLSVGADDYVTKPFSTRELVARVQTVLRRPRASATGGVPVEQAPVVFGDLWIDAAGREVRVSGASVDLTPTEFDILATLALRPGLAFSRQQILERVWGEWVGDDHVVDVHVANLRRKLGDDPGQPRYVRTVRGVGYRMGRG